MKKKMTVIVLAILGVCSLAAKKAYGRLDLESIGIEAHGKNAELHVLGVHAAVSSLKLVERVLVLNPSGQVAVNKDRTQLEWGPDKPNNFMFWSGPLDANTLFPGIYQIEVQYNDRTSELRRVEVPQNLFCSVVPTGFRVIDVRDWWLPEGGDIPQPTFAWVPFQSPQFNPANEHLSYMVEVIVAGASPEIVCWRGHNISGDVTRVDYNFDGSAAQGYETLPPGLYSAFLFAYEDQNDSSYSLDVKDAYSTRRVALASFQFDIFRFRHRRTDPGN